MDKKQIVRWVLDGLGALVAVYVVWSVNQINGLVISDIQQSAKIEAIEKTLGTISEELTRVADTMGDMVFEQEVSNRIGLLNSKDRWSAGCMGDYSIELFGLLQLVMPEITIDDRPDVQDIQKKNGF